jgi:hypothetical protein
MDEKGDGSDPRIGVLELLLGGGGVGGGGVRGEVTRGGFDDLRDVGLGRERGGVRGGEGEVVLHGLLAVLKAGQARGVGGHEGVVWRVRLAKGRRS